MKKRKESREAASGSGLSDEGRERVKCVEEDSEEIEDDFYKQIKQKKKKRKEEINKKK